MWTSCMKTIVDLSTRTVSGSRYALGYDEEYHLTSVSEATTASFVYDEGSNHVKGAVVSAIDPG